jgi:F-box protein 11
MPGVPAAFMSYVRFNDQHDDGQLTQFRERLEAEVRAQTGQEFVIFQDRNDIAWGQNWQQRIDEALETVTLLVVIITPGLFFSPACRDEFHKFLDRERALGLPDLILPVYYITAREMDDLGTREADEMATILASRQFADWRELRFEPFTSPVVRKAIARLASRMRDTFWRPSAAPERLAESRQAPHSLARLAEPADIAMQVTAKTEPPTHVVDAYQRGDFATVSAAIQAANPGDRILVRPGLYEEALVIDKPLEILGDGPIDDTVVRVRGADALVFRTSIGRVANLTLRQTGGEGSWSAVDISQGRLDLEGCDISSQSAVCVAIRNGADPRLRRNKIHDGRGGGIFVLRGGLGTLEDNDITGNVTGVTIGYGGDPTLRRNQIRDNESIGVVVTDGLCTLEDNDITGNDIGVVMGDKGNLTMRRNQIYDNKAVGAYFRGKGMAIVADNDITGNSTGNSIGGVLIVNGASPKLSGNRINSNEGPAIRISEGGGGLFEDNVLTGNSQGAWDIAEDCTANVTHARNKE